MDIIKQGDPKRIVEYRKRIGRVKELQCERCGCIFLLDLDKDSWHDDQREGASCNCPYCNKCIRF